MEVYFRSNYYRSVRIEFQKEDKLTHRRYAPSFERITQWVDKVGHYISVINLGSRYLHGPSAGRKTKMIELVIKMVRAYVDANPKRSLTHSTHGLRMKKSTVHNMLISGFKLKPDISMLCAVDFFILNPCVLCVRELLGFAST